VLSIRLSRRLLLFVALAVVLAMAVPTTARSTTALLRHGTVNGKRIALADEYSTNWAGWDNTGSTYTTVTASWIQPSVICSTKTAYSSFWIGLDGDGSNSVEQTGSEADCSHGRPVYYSWYEFYPAYPVNYSNPVRPGDHFSASVTSNGSGKYTLVLSDTTAGWTHTTTGTASSATNASAEAIAEAPSSNRGVLPLADFGTVTFTNVTVNGAALGTVPTANRLTMVTSGGATKASTSTLSGNNTFTVTWHHS
jgi:peptidase A4-like protein